MFRSKNILRIERETKRRCMLSRCNQIKRYLLFPGGKAKQSA